jgi:hypothetical protein
MSTSVVDVQVTFSYCPQCVTSTTAGTFRVTVK